VVTANSQLATRVAISKEHPIGKKEIEKITQRERCRDETLKEREKIKS
jgi:hypothetical protein